MVRKIKKLRELAIFPGVEVPANLPQGKYKK